MTPKVAQRPGHTLKAIVLEGLEQRNPVSEDQCVELMSASSSDGEAFDTIENFDI